MHLAVTLGGWGEKRGDGGVVVSEDKGPGIFEGLSLSSAPPPLHFFSLIPPCKRGKDSAKELALVVRGYIMKYKPLPPSLHFFVDSRMYVSYMYKGNTEGNIKPYKCKET